MSRKNGQRKHGTTGGSPRRKRTARAWCISCQATKSRCACQWGGWGRISDEGPGQQNLDRSEDPWGRAVQPLAWWCWPGVSVSDTERRANAGNSEHARGKQTVGIRDVGSPGRKAPPEKPALKPYWGKLTVRNSRGDDGNVGIIRSPVRAFVLPDRAVRTQFEIGL
jgi:hypothetical protein